MGRLDGQIAVVMSADSCVALASARSFRDHGAHVYLAARRPERMRGALSALGDGVTTLRGDTDGPDDVDRVFRLVGLAEGRVDVVMANVGLTRVTFPVHSASADAEYARIIRSTSFTCQSALGLMTSGGSIILAGDVEDGLSLSGQPARPMIRTGLRSMARSLAVSFAPRGVRVNSLNPRSIPPSTDDLLASIAAGGRASCGAQAEDLDIIERIASSALFLASPESTDVNGTDLSVDHSRFPRRRVAQNDLEHAMEGAR